MFKSLKATSKEDTYIYIILLLPFRIKKYINKNNEEYP